MSKLVDAISGKCLPILTRTEVTKMRSSFTEL